jgi:hypothetical protein
MSRKIRGEFSKLALNYYNYYVSVKLRRVFCTLDLSRSCATSPLKNGVEVGAAIPDNIFDITKSP